MTINKVRETIKVHIQAAEHSKKFSAALALLELLDAIDADLIQEGFFNEPDR